MCWDNVYVYYGKTTPLISQIIHGHHRLGLEGLNCTARHCTLTALEISRT